jgi:diguanylate cyclase (GGDEF)-like protein
MTTAAGHPDAGASRASHAVLVARPVWPVLRRLGLLLTAHGYTVHYAGSWEALLDGRLPAEGWVGVFLGEYGDAGEEEKLLRSFRGGDVGLGVPAILVGGENALRRTRAFRTAGVDHVVAASMAAEEILELARPLLTYGELYREAMWSNRELRECAMTDDLTGLPNRRHFTRELERNIEMARRIGRPLACIVTDIDDIRRVNETHGPPAGDSVIRQFGNMLTKAKRSYDSVARLGGDEFVWLLVNADADQAVQAAWRVHRTVSEYVFNGVHDPLRVTATWGVSSIGPGGEWTGQSLMENADRALYWGKECGKNVVRCYPPREGGPG